jgi:hypothetical protein
MKITSNEYRVICLHGSQPTLHAKRKMGTRKTSLQWDVPSQHIMGNWRHFFVPLAKTFKKNVERVAFQSQQPSLEARFCSACK